MADVAVRVMTPSDLVAASSVANAAFGALSGRGDGATEPIFPELFLAERYAGDPTGCLVAEVDGAVAGCLISCTRGALAWFGPLAVRPDCQRLGVGAALVAECVERWRSRGVTLLGLETFADSRFHVGFYGRFGFRPSWTGVSFERNLEATSMPADVAVDGRLPDIGFLFAGLDVSAQAAATSRTGAGVVLSCEEGVAIVHVEPTFQAKGKGYVPFAAARSAEGFDRLLDAAEHVAREHGCGAMFTRTSGSSWATHDRLLGRGYRVGSLAVRMKAGEDLDYDRGERFYLDNWL